MISYARQCCCCCYIQCIGCQPEKNTLHGGQSRSWSAEQGKKKKKKKSAIPSRAARSEKKKKTRRIYMPRRYADLGPSRIRTRTPWTRRLGQRVSLRKILRFRMLWQLSRFVASLLSWRFPSRVTSPFLHAAMNLRPPSATVSTHTSDFHAIAFQSPVMPNARMSLCTQWVHLFSFPPRPLRAAPSRFPNTIRFGSRPPLIRMIVPAHRSLLVRIVDSMLSHWVISRARLNEVNRWFGVLRCAPMMRSKTRWCTVRSLAVVNIV